MKKFLIFTVLAFFVFGANGHSNDDDDNGLRAPGPTVSATTGSVPGKDPYITEIYYWDATSQSYKLEDRYNAHIKLTVPVSVNLKGKGYFSLWSQGALHKYSSPYHPEDEEPAHVSALKGDSVTGVKLGSGWPFIIFSGQESRTVTAEGTLVTDTSNKYELKGKGKLDTSTGGGSGSIRIHIIGVGGGTSPISGSTGWIPDTTSFRVGVLDIRPSRPDDPPTDNTPNCPDCTSDCSSPCSCMNSGTCGGTVVTPEPPSSNCDAGCCSGYCWHAGTGGNCAATCIYSDEPYYICTSQQGDCTSSPDGWHYSE